MLSRLLKKSNEGPSFTQRRLFTSEQKAFYGRLRRALPKCYIFPDIQLSKLIVPTSTDGRGRRNEFELLIGRTVDFAVFDARLNLLCVIELMPPEGASAEQVQNAGYLASAGIRLFRWDADGLPSTDQMLRALADFSHAGASGEGESLTQMGEGDAASAPVRLPPSPPPTEIRYEPRPRYLTQEALDALAPREALKTGFGHVWNRICLFAKDPRELDHYLVSLSVQDRGVKRAGFSPEALSEMGRILEANAAFMQQAPTTMRAGWNDVFTNR